LITQFTLPVVPKLVFLSTVILVVNITDVTVVTVGNAVAQLVEALRYTPEGREFDSRWCHWNFSLT